MWNLRLTQEDKKGIFSSRNKKFKIQTYAYRIGYYTKGNKSILNAMLLLEGTQINKDKFVNSLKSDKSIKNIEIKNNLLNCSIVKPKNKDEQSYYSLELIHTKPVITDKNGIEHWELASWNRKVLEKVLKISNKSYNGKLEHFKILNLSEIDLLFFSLYPKLTEKQKKAFFSALESGYYEFPRKTTLDNLAKQMHLSYTTYQFHLRNAEKKIMHSVGAKI